MTDKLLKAVLLVVPAGVFVTAAGALSLAAMQTRADDAPAEARPATRPAAVADDYPLDQCPVGGKLGAMGEPVVRTIDGRRVEFCCEGCVARFEADRGAYHAKMDAMILEVAEAEYPLATCVVSGEDLDAMGGPVAVVHRPTNTAVKFCCGTCEVAFAKDPEPYLAKLREARGRAGEVR